MKKFYLSEIMLVVFFIACVCQVSAQCMTYPVPLEQRVSKAQHIVMGKVIDQQSYIDEATGNIYTSNKIKVTAWLKNHLPTDEVYVITVGGVVGNKAMIAHPALELDTYHEYLLMLEADNHQVDNKALRVQHPQTLQMLPYADVQGSLTNENNYYHDLHYRTPTTEAAIFGRISMLTLQIAKKPSGELFTARNTITSSPNGTAAISGFSPASVHSGTILAADQITISGSGFGAAAGTIFYSNADDGGATFTASGVASDNVSWADGSIINKPARRAGTGPINVNGTFTSGSNLLVPYSHIDINSSFSAFGVTTRQRYYLVDKNAEGGYTFTYNTAFAANTSAVNAFQRALLLWRCNTFINIKYSNTTSAVTTAVPDGINLILFDATLPAGVLGRATSRFSGNATGGCNLHNTVWHADEMDMQFKPDPPAVGFTWQFGPAVPTASQYDFESVALHEMGHLHGLGHIINPLGVMHYSLANGVTSRVISTDDIAGGVAKMNYSTLPLCFTPAGVNGPMVPLNAANCVLAVNLSNFYGERINKTANKLNWTTANEINNDGFFLQRSDDDNNFKDIGFIKSAGNSNQNTYYNYIDNTAGAFSWFYRLKQVDLSGAERFSKTIYIPGIKIKGWKIWASETGSKVFIYKSEASGEAAVINLVNMMGQQVLSKQINNSSNEINTAHLPRGIYYYQLQEGNQKITGKLILGTIN